MSASQQSHRGSVKPGNIVSDMSNPSPGGFARDSGNVPSWNQQLPLKITGPQKNWFNNLPTTSNASRQNSIKVYGGQSQTNNAVTYPTVATIWDNANYANELFEGQLVMAFKGDPGDASTIEITLRAVNTELRQLYREADTLFKRGLKSGIDGSLSSKQLETLCSLHTCTWSNVEFLRNSLKSISGNATSLGFLFEEGCADLWHLYGIVQGQLSEDISTKQITIGRYGMMEVCENIWGKNATPSSKLYLIFKRIRYNDGSYGPFQYIPYASIDEPSQALRQYEDYTGHTRYGRVMEIGQVIWWRSKANKEEFNLLEDAGLVDPSENRQFKRSAAAELRIALTTRSGMRIMHLLG